MSSLCHRFKGNTKMFTLTWPVCVPWSVPNPTESKTQSWIQLDSEQTKGSL